MDTEDAAQDTPTGPEPIWSEGLRERKKRMTRRLISDTATAMFLERGFDDVKVTEVAEACGVSEKTVYNYFPAKESLLLDREPESAAAIWRTLGPGSPLRSPVEACLKLLDAQMEEMYVSWSSDGIAVFRRFCELVAATPSLQAAERDMNERLIRTAAEAMAEKAGVSPDDPEPQIAATAVLGLWRVQFDAVRRLASQDRSPDEIRRVVTDEVTRAGRLIESGLWAFGALTEEPHGRQQFRSGAETAEQAARQVVAALRQARAAWQEVQKHPERYESAQALQGLATLLEQAEPWTRDLAMQQDQWKQAYRVKQTMLRQAQRELQQRFRETNQQHREQARAQWNDGRRRGRRPNP